MTDCSPDKCPFRLLKKLTDAGLENFDFHKGSVQDKIVVKLTLIIEDKEVTIKI